MPVGAASRHLGPYLLIERLGLGGMAEVYLASHEPMPGSPRLVAIKKILANLVDQPSFLQMFLDEARVLSRLYHPNLDRVLGAGEHEGVPYIVLDYVPGRDLGVVLRAHHKRGLLPMDVSVHIAARVAAGLCHAHGLCDERGENLGIVHRDLSPENIIVTFEGTVKVVDFGVARGSVRAQVTEPGLIKGKPSFMAPEQILARPIDHRADIFAMGVLLYRLTVGGHPFGVQGHDPRTFMRLLDTIPTPPHLLVPDYPHTLSAVIMKALEREPYQRQASAEELLSDLEGVMRERGWFPSDSRLSRLMNELFHDAAEAARRLGHSPGDTAAATRASYLTRGDLRIDEFEVDLENEDTEMGTVPGTNGEEQTATETRPDPRFASFIGTKAPRLSDAIPADMDTIPTGPGPGGGPPVEEPARPATKFPRAASTPLAPKDARLDLPPPTAPKERSLRADREARKRDELCDSREKETSIDIPRRRLGDPAPLDEETNLDDPAPPPPKEPTHGSVLPARRARSPGVDRSPGGGSPASSLPPPTADVRLLGDPEAGEEDSISVLPTHSALVRRGAPEVRESNEEATSLGSIRTSPRWSRAGAEGERAPGQRSSERAVPPWRTPAGLTFTVVITVTVAGAIFFSLFGH